MLLELKKDDIIDVVATSSGNFDFNTEDVKNFMQEIGYNARLSDNFQKEYADPFAANTDKIRAKNLINALSAVDSSLIWAFRGGYGATRLISILEKIDFSKKEKVIIGYSDLTALGIYFSQVYNWKFIHFDMISNCLRNKKSETIEIIVSLINNSWDRLSYDLVPLNDLAKEDREIESKIVGGNLSIVECSLGTKWQINTKNKILFFEEVNEQGYRVDRSIQHLKDAGCFDEVVAIIVGDLSCNTEQKGGKTSCDVAVERFVKEMSVPVFQSSSFGHVEHNQPLLLNYTAQIKMGETPVLSFDNKK